MQKALQDALCSLHFSPDWFEIQEILIPKYPPAFGRSAGAENNTEIQKSESENGVFLNREKNNLLCF